MKMMMTMMMMMEKSLYLAITYLLQAMVDIIVIIPLEILISLILPTVVLTAVTLVTV